MSALPGLVGLGGGASGTGFAGPTNANIANPVAANQISSAYSGTQGSLAQQQALLQALQGQNGLGNQNQVYGQLQGVANGTGQNPAQAMLNQSTGQNIANQGALMSGQRGAASNVGLIARQAAQQGAATQQQAVGQGASLQAQQSLNAIGQAGSIASTQAGQQIGQTNANTSAQQGEQAALLNAQAQYNQQQVAMQSNINNANAGLANTTMGNQSGTIGGALSGLGASGLLGNGGSSGLSAAGAALAAADGGEVPGQSQSPDGPQSEFGKFLMGTAEMAQGGNVGGMLKSGGPVPGRPAVPGAVNSYKNDTVKALLSPGEIVIPRAVSMSEDPVGEAAKFVANVIAKRKGRPS